MIGCEPAVTLSDAELGQITALVHQRAGISLNAGKRALIVARLQKRLRLGGFRSFSEYLQYVEHDATGAELVGLLDAIATNHTSFFREDQHFAFLAARAAAEWGSRGEVPIRGWSAGCSTGEEPYSIAITLLEALDHPTLDLLASDLSTKALALAMRAVYKLDRVQAVPRDLLREYFERGVGEQDGLARVGVEVRRHVRFAHRNLLEIGDFGERFDFIFCRNVMIYFDREVQQRVVTMLERRLVPGGYLFVSHSETLNGVTHGLRWVAPAVYQRGRS